MIITCEKCSTRFNLDDSLIKESGSKVRCSVCKHIFTAYPAPNDLEPDSKISDDLSLETGLSDNQSFDETDDFQMEDSDFSLEETEMSDSELSLEDPEIPDSDLSLDSTDLSMEDSELEIEAPEFEADEVQSDDLEDDFSFEDNEFEMETEAPSNEFEFEDVDVDVDVDTSDTFEMDEGELEIEEDGLEFEAMEDDETPALVIEDEPPELELAEPPELELNEPEEPMEPDESAFSEEDEFELEFDVDDEPTAELDETPGSLDEPGLEIATDTKDDEDLLSIEETGDDEPPEITPEEDFSEYDKVLEQETEPDTEILEEETISIDDIEEETVPTLGKKEALLESRPRTRRRKKKSLVGAPVLILLLIFLLIIGAYIASMMTGYKIPYLSDIKIPYIEQYLKKPEPVVNEAKPVPNRKSVNGRFVTNTTAGTLFVITGRVENPASISYSHIKILGTLITKGKTEAKTKTVYCGNIVSEEMLKTGNISDINKILMTETGNLNANINVKPGATIPFMVVFSDLPEKLQNFTVKVTTFDKAPN